MKERLVAGPILHILPSEPVQLLAPARFTIPVILGEDIPKCPDYLTSGYFAERLKRMKENGMKSQSS